MSLNPCELFGATALPWAKLSLVAENKSFPQIKQYFHLHCLHTMCEN